MAAPLATGAAKFPAPAPAKQSKGERTRERIIRCALDLFSESGSSNVSLRDIAAAAGLTHAGLLHHFASKDELILQVLTWRDALQFDRALRPDDTLSPHWRDPHAVAGVFAQLINVVRLNAESPTMISLFVKLSAEATDPEHPAHAYFVARYERVVESFTEAFAARFSAHPPAIAIAPEAAARQLVALMDGLQLQWILRDPTAPDAFGMTDDVVTFLRLLGIDLPGDASDTRKARDD
ncbi:MAG: TetR/AcrR family transcriptional regulator [Propioniciclava sp.]